MTLKDRVKALAQERGISLPALESELGFGNSTIVKWDKSTPNADKLNAVAKYFNVTMDYLLNGTVEEMQENDSDEPYYLNDETRQIAQEAFENPDLRSLFHVARDIDPEELRAHIDFMKRLKAKEQHNNDEGC